MKITYEQYDQLNNKLGILYEEAMQEKIEMESKDFKDSYALGMYAGIASALSSLDIKTYLRTSDGCAQIEPSMVVK